MVLAAVTYETPESIYRDYYKNKKDIRVFMRKFFSEYFVNTLCSFPDWETDISNQEGLLVGVCFLNWERWLKAQHAELDKHLTNLEETAKKNKERIKRDSDIYIRQLRTEGNRTEEQIQALARRAYPNAFPENNQLLDYSSWMIGIKILNEKGDVDYVIGDKKQQNPEPRHNFDDDEEGEREPANLIIADEVAAPRNIDQWLDIDPPLIRRNPR